LIAAVAAVTSESAAQVLGEGGQFALGAERLSGVVRASDTADVSNDATSTTSFTSVSLLVARTNAASTYSFPRIGLDYFVADSVSIGMAIGMFTLSGSQETELMGQSSEQDLNDILGFLFAPRVGYAFAFSESAAIWPRAGITFVTASSDDPDTDATGSMNRLALSLDVPFVLSPAPHVGILLGPAIDFGVTGSNSIESGGMSTDVDVTSTDFGLHAGLVAYF
jgi:hypothetical protein